MQSNSPSPQWQPDPVLTSPSLFTTLQGPTLSGVQNVYHIPSWLAPVEALAEATEHFADTELSGSRSPIHCREYGLPQDFTDHHFPSDCPRYWFLLPSLQHAVTQPQVLKHRPQSLCVRARANLFSWGTTLLTHPSMCWCNVAPAHSAASTAVVLKDHKQVFEPGLGFRSS